MTSTFWFIAGVVLLAIAVVVYTVFLPHVEGPSLDDQAADHKEWLVCCPECGRWQSITPRASSEEEKRQSPQLESTYTNWYTCGRCQHRWHEDHRF